MVFFPFLPVAEQSNERGDCPGGAAVMCFPWLPQASGQCCGPQRYHMLSKHTHRPLFFQHSPSRARPTLCFQYLPRTGRMEGKGFSVAHNLGDTPSGSEGKQ